MRIVLLACLLFLFTASGLSAQNDKPKKGNKYPNLIKLEEKPNKGQLQKFFNDYYHLKGKDKLKLKKGDTDALGFSHEAYQQSYNGIEVEGATLKAHIKNNKVWYLSGSFIDIFEDVNTTPTLSSSAAFTKAKSHVGASRYVWDDGEPLPQGSLVVIGDPDGKNVPHLAYKFDIYATAPLYRAYVYVDAHSGQVVRENLRIHDTNAPVSGVSLYNGTVNITADNTGGTNHRLRQTADGNGIQTFNLNNGTNYGAATDFTDNGLPFNSDASGVQAHFGAEQTHKFYLQKLGRNSYNNAGAVINSYVHYSSGYVNAFWDGTRMTYGDGDGVNYGPLVSLDIVGHEITHGVTEYSANLVYSYESGALNESFSDIFGEAVENFAAGSNNWQMGTDIGIGGSGALRSMNNPNAFGDPDTYLGTYWYSGSADNGGVHTNSGVQNKWFYILTTGESGTNDLGNSYNVTGIGIEKAAAIAYRNLTVYLSSNSGYFDARAGAIQAAEDLYGAGSPEQIATANAWYAVGVGGPYGSITYCSSQGNNSSYEWIANVSIGTFSNSSGAAGYTDFTGQTVNVDEGQSYNISLTPGFGGTVYNEYWKVWIDYNKDGDFSDAGELAYTSGGLSSTTVTGTISIPNGLAGTTTRMRVSMKWNAAQTECETFSYGEVEDYTIAIAGSAPIALSAAISAATDISCNGAADGAATVSASGGVSPYAYSWSNGSTSASISNLSAGSYTVTVTDADSPASTATASVTITEPTALSSAPSGTDVSCGGTNNGAAAANASGGTAPLSYSWTGPGGFTASTANISGLAQGGYQLTVTDANGCTASGSVTITDPNSTYYADTDGDTYGDPGNSVRACSAPAGYVSNNSDCNDGSGAINPGATEICDGIDNNCDGNIDEGFTQNTYYADSDGDTYGNPAVSVTACVQPAGYVTDNTDCNDASAAAYPGATEICDGIDNNCDGTVDEGCGSNCSNLVNFSDFESGWGIWSDGGSDCQRSSGDAAYALGTYCVRLRDNTSSSVTTTSNLNLSAYSGLTVDFTYIAVSMENNEDFWLQISTNGGSSYTTVASWSRGPDFNNNVRYYESVEISGISLTSNTRLRFRCDASGNSDWVYIDEVSIYGCTGSALQAPIVTVAEQAAADLNISPSTTAISDAKGLQMRVFPNPVHDQLTIAYSLPATGSAYIVVTDLTGKTLKREKLNADQGEQRYQLDVSRMTDGFYFVHLVTDQERHSEKFIVVK